MTSESATTAGRTAEVEGRPLSPLWPVALVVFVNGIGLGLLLPLLPYFTQSLGASAATVTQLVAIYAVATLAGGPLLGGLSDRVGRRGVICLALTGLTVANVGMAFAPSLAALFAFRALSGLMAGNEAVTQALVSAGCSSAEQVRRIGALGASRAAGMILGPAFSGGLAVLLEQPDLYYRVTLLAVAALSATALVLTLLVVPRTPLEPRRGGGEGVRSDLEAGREIVALIVLTVAISYAFAVMQSVTALFVQAAFRWGPAETGAVQALAALAIIVARLRLASALSGRLGELAALTVGCLTACVLLAVLAFGPPPMVFLLAHAGFCLAYGVLLILTTAGVARRAPPAHRGVLLGMNQSAFALATAASAALNGPLFQYVDIHAPFAAGAIVMAPALVVCAGVLLRQRWSRQQTAATGAADV